MGSMEAPDLSDLVVVEGSELALLDQLMVAPMPALNAALVAVMELEILVIPLMALEDNHLPLVDHENTMVVRQAACLALLYLGSWSTLMASNQR